MLAPSDSKSIDRREHHRRKTDQSIDHLQQTFHSCLEFLADGVILLSDEMKVVSATQQAQQLVSQHAVTLSLEPIFTLYDPRQALRLKNFAISRKPKAEPVLSLLLENNNIPDPLLLNCFRLPISHARCYARFMITLRFSTSTFNRHFQVFVDRYHLTCAETRLCRMLADGFTLQDYCEHWHVAITTARSQLGSIFSKTSTNRQSALLRLIFLFIRN